MVYIPEYSSSEGTVSKGIKKWGDILMLKFGGSVGVREAPQSMTRSFVGAISVMDGDTMIGFVMFQDAFDMTSA